MFSIKNREDLRKLEELASLQNRVEEVRLRGKVGKQNIHQNIRKVLEPVTDTKKCTSENLTKTITEPYIENNKALEILNETVLELMKHKSMIAPYLAYSLVNLFKTENKSQFKKIKHLNSTEMNDCLINTSVQVNVYSNMLTFRHLLLERDLLRLMTNYIFSVDHSNPHNRKVNHEFGEELKIDIKQVGRPNTRDVSLIKLFESPAIMDSGI